MSADTADVVIIGGGPEGAAAAWTLARRGVSSVVVAERSRAGAGGTGKSSGVIRCHYGLSSLAKMASNALEVFENAQEILGADVGFHQTGHLVGVGASSVAALRASLEDQRRAGVDTREIGPADVAELWPVANLDDFAAFAWEPRGGYGDARQSALAFAAAARRDGVRIRPGPRVTDILTRSNQVTGVRRADGSMISAPTVVVTAGPWSVALLEAQGIDIPVTVHREQVVLVEPGTRLGPVPVFSDLVSRQYVRPGASGKIRFGSSDLSAPHPAGFLEAAVGKMAHRFPGLTLASIASTYAGWYEVTPDLSPVISRTPVDGLIAAVGFSGYGCTISPSAGQLIADLVIDGKSGDQDIDERDFRLSRFAAGEPRRSPDPLRWPG